MWKNGSILNFNKLIQGFKIVWCILFDYKLEKKQIFAVKCKNYNKVWLLFKLLLFSKFAKTFYYLKLFELIKPLSIVN